MYSLDIDISALQARSRIFYCFFTAISLLWRSNFGPYTTFISDLLVIEIRSIPVFFVRSAGEFMENLKGFFIASFSKTYRYEHAYNQYPAQGAVKHSGEDRGTQKFGF